jgi:aminomethyltransferase
MSSSLNRTPLHAAHQRAGARLVDFAGWHMPLHYGSQIEEHHIVRRAAGVFDVSHMASIDVTGSQAREFLRWVLANDVDRLKTVGQALYSCLLGADGGVLDDLIVYHRGALGYRLVVNAATAAGDWAHLSAEARSWNAGVQLERPSGLAMLAVQGPEARTRLLPVLPASLAPAVDGLRPFHAVWAEDWMVARTGYTGEDGYELLLPAGQAEVFWETLREAGVRPVGLGARDTLRLEAGMNLYGQDMDATTTPDMANLAWTVAWNPPERNFLGRQALSEQRAQGVPARLVGAVLEGRGVLRHGMPIQTDAGPGVVTSGSFSPTLGRSIGLLRIPQAAHHETVTVAMRDQTLPLHVVKPPFVRHGQILVAL